MKKLFSILFFSWLICALSATIFHFYTAFHWVWLGVFLVAGAPLLKTFWNYDVTQSIHHKVKSPRVSLLVMIGVAWVLLTLPERGWALWFALGGLGGFLLHTYWATADEE